MFGTDLQIRYHSRIPLESQRILFWAFRGALWSDLDGNLTEFFLKGSSIRFRCQRDSRIGSDLKVCSEHPETASLYFLLRRFSASKTFPNTPKMSLKVPAKLCSEMVSNGLHDAELWRFKESVPNIRKQRSTVLALVLTPNTDSTVNKVRLCCLKVISIFPAVP